MKWYQLTWVIIWSGLTVANAVKSVTTGELAWTAMLLASIALLEIASDRFQRELKKHSKE